MDQESKDLRRIIGESPSLQQLKADIQQAAAGESSVLITGESGTGKELVAQALHQLSPRRSRPFVALNCAGFPETLLESELFGHEKGAFTGAHAAQPGKLELAHRGTLLLDEIAEMSPTAQAKLLRAIESREVYRLGGRQPLRLDFRVLAATLRDLEEAMDQGRFRSDLYFRLNAVCFHLPPLRERRDDIPLLLTHYVEEGNPRWGKEVAGFTPQALEALFRYSWPGNIRELRHLVEASLMRCRSAWISLEDLPHSFHRQLHRDQGLPPTERDLLLLALLTHQGNRTRAARHLGWSRAKLYRKMDQYGLDRIPGQDHD